MCKIDGGQRKGKTLFFFSLFFFFSRVTTLYISWGSGWDTGPRCSFLAFVASERFEAVCATLSGGRSVCTYRGSANSMPHDAIGRGQVRCGHSGRLRAEDFERAPEAGLRKRVCPNETQRTPLRRRARNALKKQMLALASPGQISCAPCLETWTSRSTTGTDVIDAASLLPIGMK